MFIPGMLSICFWFTEFLRAEALFLLDAVLRRCIPGTPARRLVLCSLRQRLLPPGPGFFFRVVAFDLISSLGLLIQPMERLKNIP